MESLLVFGTALGLVAVLEIGDKTQLVTISLAARHPWASVLAGAIVGLVAATAIGAAIGGLLATTLSPWLALVKAAGGILFIALGIRMIMQALRQDAKAPDGPIPKRIRSVFTQTAAFLFLAEFGDKTQLAVIILAATSAAPVSVFAGASLAIALVALTSVVIGAGLSKVVAARWVERVSAALFVTAGVLLILDAFDVF